MQPTPEELHPLFQSLTEKVMAKAESDPLWKQRLSEDADAAMSEARFPEVEKLREIHQNARPQSLEGGEVRGHEALPNMSNLYTNWADAYGSYIPTDPLIPSDPLRIISTHLGKVNY
jgi:hypothetical protein